jgi:hypothetical protein
VEQHNRTGRRRTPGLLAKALSAPWHATRWTGHALWATARAAGSFAGEQIPEALLLGGACALTYGIAQIYVPAAWIAGGLLLLLVGWRLGRPVAEVKNG